MAGRYLSGILTRTAAIIVTVWFVSNFAFLVDETYRSGLRAAWRVRFGEVNYSQILNPEKALALHQQKKSSYLDNLLDIPGSSLLKKIEVELENALLKMFQRKDKMKGWEIKKIGADAWATVKKLLAKLHRQIKNDDEEGERKSPMVENMRTEDVEMNNVLIYNRIAKSGSTLLMSLLYKLREKLGFLVVRGKYHSYRYFRDNDRKGLGHFLEQASSRARMVYIQHQYYINFTEFHIDQPRYINMMRDPLEQFISWYYYKRTNLLFHRDPSNMTTEERKIISQSLEECVVERRLECVYYGYTAPRNKTNQLDYRENWTPQFFHPNDVLLHFCGHEKECTSLGSPLALQRAKYNVEHHFAVVGLLEYLQESAAVFEHYLPEWFTGLKDLLQEEGTKNKNSVKSDLQISEDVRNVMKYRLADVYELYNFVKQKLFKQFKAINE